MSTKPWGSDHTPQFSHPVAGPATTVPEPPPVPQMSPPGYAPPPPPAPGAPAAPSAQQVKTQGQVLLKGAWAGIDGMLNAVPWYVVLAGGVVLGAVAIKKLG
jgi:hypothetical protein